MNLDRSPLEVVFNFQIAERSVQLLPDVASPWEPVRLDALEDLIASKMTALIERGIPRDFVDIYEVCQAKIVVPEQCWNLWLEREQKRGREPDLRVAREAILLHLGRIEKMRPLDSIRRPEERRQAEKIRSWYKKEFTNST